MKKMIYKTKVYTFQIDFMRHVSNIVYVQWMEVGRSMLLDEIGMPISQIAKQGFGPVLVETIINYKKPLELGDEVSMEVWLSELAAATAWMEFRFYNQFGVLCASGRQRGLFIDLSSGRTRRISAEQRVLFEPYLGNGTDIN